MAETDDLSARLAAAYATQGTALDLGSRKGRVPVFAADVKGLSVPERP